MSNRFKKKNLRKKVTPYKIKLSKILSESSESDLETDPDFSDSELIFSTSCKTKLSSESNSELNLKFESLNLSDSKSTIVMAQPQATSATISNNNKTGNNTDVFNNLRVPDAIKNLLKFDGNPRLLYDFINNVEEILSLISGIDGTPCGRLLLRAIRNKIEGEANQEQPNTILFRQTNRNILNKRLIYIKTK